jgi:hypothetical protein
LTGGPITTTGTVIIDSTKAPLLNALNIFTQNQSVIGWLGVGTSSPGAMIDVEGTKPPSNATNGVSVPNALMVAAGSGGDTTSIANNTSGGAGGGAVLTAGAGGNNITITPGVEFKGGSGAVLSLGAGTCGGNVNGN